MTLVEHLTQCRCTDVKPGKLTIGRHTFAAATYTQNDQRLMYVIGEFPPILRRKRNMCLNINGMPADWYVAAHMQREIPDEFKNSHPFGKNFLLSLWDIAEPIDKYNYWRGEHKPYLRIQATWENDAR